MRSSDKASVADWTTSLTDFGTASNCKAREWVTGRTASVFVPAGARWEISV